MITPLIELAFEGKSFIDPEIESRIVEVKNQDENSPMAILEPNEKIVAKMLAAGQSNEQIAARLGFKDKRTISRINGQIYAAWDLNESSSDEKVARNKVVPYLKTVSLLLFGVFVLVFFLFIGGGIGIIQDPVFQSDNDPRSFYGFLIGIQILVRVAILILGQALISYEIFTGRILPKINLRKEWRNAILGYLLLSLFCVFPISNFFSPAHMFTVFPERFF